jgi:hypothetical protein
MFTLKILLSAFKSHKSETDGNLKHCRVLEARARALGFQSYHHFCNSLSGLPPDQFGKVSLGVMRYICQQRLPQQDCAYFEFRVLPNHGIGFYSHWIGWDDLGEEVRAPRPLEGLETAKSLRGVMKDPVYVVETQEELDAWQFIWRSTALIPEALAKEHFKRSFDKAKYVSANPPIDLIRRNANRYDNNFAADEPGI